MKRILFSFSLLLLACNGFAQKGFGIDGSIGMGYNGGDLVYPLLLEGRVQFNDYLSLNLGLGLWNSGLKDSWHVDTEITSTIYKLSSNKTLPSLQLSTRGQIPVFTYRGKDIRFFVEPTLFFLPFSAQKATLKGELFNKETNDLTNVVTYTPTGQTTNVSLKSECHPRLYGGVQAGLMVDLTDNIDLAVSYGYTNMDLFKDLRGGSISGFQLNSTLPRANLQLFKIGFLVNLDLN